MRFALERDSFRRVVATAALLLVAGCTTTFFPADNSNLPQGPEGPRGERGPAGVDGQNGLACWDLDGNRVPDVAEDINGDGIWDARDCQGQPEMAVLMAVFGNGAAGPRTITEDIRFQQADGANQQWTDFTINAGVTLTVQSGTVIRCLGKFTNNGTIIVETGAEGADRVGVDSSSPGSTRNALPGISTLAAGNGEVGNTSDARSGGQFGSGLSEFEARLVLNPGTRAGGSGAAGLGAGGAGGGSLVILASDEIVLNGDIMAPGGNAPSTGGGGGGGGVIIIASAQKITSTQNAMLMANGGAGGDASNAEAAGGGGGGGIVHLIAPDIVNAGQTSVAGGSAGANGAAGSVTAGTRAGGGGGGASGGSGGAGGNVTAGVAADPEAAGNGASGFFLMTETDPIPFF